MELEKMRELIEKAKLSATNEESVQLIASFEDFIELYHLRDEYRGDGEFIRRLEAAHKKFWASFDKTAASFGFSPQMVKESFNDPSHYTSEQWQNLQAIRAEIQGIEAPKPKKMFKKANKTVRI